MVGDEVRERIRAQLKHRKLCVKMMIRMAQGPGHVLMPSVALPTHCLLQSSPNGLYTVTISICQMRKLRSTEVLLLD